MQGLDYSGGMMRPECDGVVISRNAQVGGKPIRFQMIDEPAAR